MPTDTRHKLTMENKTDNEPLLNDVLAEAAPADLRIAMLGETLRVVRRHRRLRQTRRATALLVVLVSCGIFVWQQNPPQKPVAPVPSSVAKTVEKSYALVETQPLPAGNIVTTQPLVSHQLAAAVKIVQTQTGNYHVINDDQLLALLGAHPAVLIRTGPHSEKLVFANPKDQNGFPLN